MPFSDLDGAALGRSLGQIADREEDIADLFLERREEVAVCGDEGEPGVVLRREEGFALRLLREGQSWIAARDGLDQESLGQALREVARAQPRMPFRPPRAFTGGAWSREGSEVSEVVRFPAAVARRIRAGHVAFPLRLEVRRHRRWVQVVGPRLIGDPMAETFYSVEAESDWGCAGLLLLSLDDESAERVATGLIERFRARQASGRATGTGPPLVLGPAATAVLLHEAVAHALEADTLILSGRPEAACGFRLGSEHLDVLDDPAGAPSPVARRFDDEGMPASRRWLLRGGEVREPLADRFFSRHSARLTPGAARRADRHSPPAPRSTHLELLAGETPTGDLWRAARDGVYLPEVDRGHLDPVRGEFRLHFPFARRIGEEGPADFLGPCALRGRVGQLLTAIEAVGAEARFAGAGWCAKGGQRMPVWATCPGLLVTGLELVS